MPTIVDDLRSRVRKRTSHGGASGLADMKFMDNIKSTRALIQREGVIGVTQKVIAGERPITGKLIPTGSSSSLQRYREPELAAPSSSRKWKPINTVS